MCHTHSWPQQYVTIPSHTLESVWTVVTDVTCLLKDVRYSKAQKMLKFTFNALIQQLYCWKASSYYVSYSSSEAYKIGSKHTIWHILKLSVRDNRIHGKNINDNYTNEYLLSLAILDRRWRYLMQWIIQIQRKCENHPNNRSYSVIPWPLICVDY